MRRNNMTNVLIYSESKKATLFLFLSPRMFVLIQVNIFTLLMNVNSGPLTDYTNTSLWTTPSDSSTQQWTPTTVSDANIESYWSIRTNLTQMLPVDRSYLKLETSTHISIYDSASNEENLLKTAQLKDAMISLTVQFSAPDEQHFVALTHNESVQTSGMTQQLIISSAKSESVFDTFSHEALSNMILLSSQTQLLTEKDNNVVDVPIYKQTDEASFFEHPTLTLSVDYTHPLSTLISTEEIDHTHNRQFTSTIVQAVWPSDEFIRVPASLLDFTTPSLVLSSYMISLSLYNIMTEEYPNMLSSSRTLETIPQNYLSAEYIATHSDTIDIITLTVLESTVVISQTGSFSSSSVLMSMESSALLTDIAPKNVTNSSAGSSTFLHDLTTANQSDLIDGSSTFLLDFTSTKQSDLIDRSLILLTDITPHDDTDLITVSSKFLADLTTTNQTDLTDVSPTFAGDLTTINQTDLTDVSPTFPGDLTTINQTDLTNVSPTFPADLTTTNQTDLTDVSPTFPADLTTTNQTDLTDVSPTFPADITTINQTDLTDVSPTSPADLTTTNQTDLTDVSPTFAGDLTTINQTDLTDVSPTFPGDLTTINQTDLTDVSPTFPADLTTTNQTDLTDVSPTFPADLTTTNQTDLTDVSPTFPADLTTINQTDLTDVSPTFPADLTTTNQTDLTDVSPTFPAYLTTINQTDLTDVSPTFPGDLTTTNQTDLTDVSPTFPADLTTINQTDLTDLSPTFPADLTTTNQTDLTDGSPTFPADLTTINQTDLTDGSPTFPADITTINQTDLTDWSSTFPADLTTINQTDLTDWSSRLQTVLTTINQTDLTDVSSTFPADLTTTKQTDLTDWSSRFKTDLSSKQAGLISHDDKDDTITTYSPATLEELSLITVTDLLTSPENNIPDETDAPASTATEYSSVLTELSVVQTVTISPTSTVLTTSIQQGIENGRNDINNWVLTNFRIPTAVDILSAEFKSHLEKGLANCYYLARRRDEEIQNGTYVPLYKRRRRFSSSEADNNTAVDIIYSKRLRNTSSVEVVYVVEESGEILKGTLAATQLKLLSDQEVAIYTGHIVSLIAEPYNRPADEPNDPLKWIIIGCVLGAALLIIIIVLVACLYPCNHHCLKTNTYKVKTPDDSPENDHQNKALPLPVHSGDHETTKSTTGQGKIRAGKEVPARRSSTSERTSIQQNAAVNNVKTELGNKKKPKQKKIRKKSFNTEEDIQLVYKNQIQSLSTAGTETSSLNVLTLRSQPTVEEESDLLDNAEQERRRNKERVRAKKMIENKHLSPAKVMNKLDTAYLNAQREIDKVLEPQSFKSKGHHRDKVMNRKDHVEIHENDIEAYKGDEKDSLEDARTKMHKLLDDAFDVLSQRKSDMISKVQPHSEMSSKANPFTRMEQIVQTDESMLSHKLHKPVQVHHSYAFNDPEGLITWNPYTAYDDTKLISLNNPETNMSPVPGKQENMKASNFSQSLRPQSNYYTTEPGKPIIIKTRNLQDVIPQSCTEQKISTAKHGINENIPSSIKSRNLHASQNPVFNSSIPDKTSDMYPNNFYELSCFQETPTTSQLIKAGMLNSTQPNSSSSLYEDSGRTVSVHQPYAKSHTEPNKSVDKNSDIVDIIKQSLQPGISPQPLIDSLRKELQTLSSKAQAATKKDI